MTAPGDEDLERSDPAAAERDRDTSSSVDDAAAARNEDDPRSPADLAAMRGRADEADQLADPLSAITGSAEAAIVRGINAADVLVEAREVALDTTRRAGDGSPDILHALQSDEVVSAFLKLSDQFLAAQGFTEHGFRHANLVGRIAHNVLHHLGADDDLCELAAVSGYMHDIGNVVSRMNHGLSSAWVAYDALRRLEVDPYRIGVVLSAVGNHEEQYGSSVGPIGAAVILADKADVHRSRVRKGADTAADIHDRVNDAVTHSFLRVDSDAATITLELELDTDRSTVLEYFEIFLDRMIMCRRAARTLGCEFRITANGVAVG
ncbi:MAG: hypothetical protein WEB03_02500 [Nitriliruptor sp.]|uniref:hypothetical protein n=1 Tax=Nitriliruptor sp. TaxID=2448056 RepID=UPI0034A07A06